MAEPAGQPAPTQTRAPVDMRFPLRPVLLFFLTLVPAYLLVFWGTEYVRGKDGPWRLVFSSDAAGVPSLLVEHPGILAGGMELKFSEEKVEPGQRVECLLDKPIKPLPWGKRISEDLTFLPGTLAIDAFGHEVEIAPRILVVNRKEIPWGSQMHLVVNPADKLPVSERFTPKAPRPLAR